MKIYLSATAAICELFCSHSLFRDYVHFACEVSIIQIGQTLSIWHKIFYEHVYVLQYLLVSIL